MPDPVTTTIGIGAIAAYLSKDGLQKLLGPTADYLGGELQEYTQRRIETVGKILANAEAKVGDKSNEPGVVPPRILKEIINEASYFENELALEYIGGVLASSRTPTGRDDRGVCVAKMIGGLSSYQLRAHYIIYTAIRDLFRNVNLRFNVEGRPKMQIFLPFNHFASAMDFDETELGQFAQLINHIFYGLYSVGLIETEWRSGPQSHISEAYKDAKEGGILCSPSALGAELYLNAFGAAEHVVEHIFSEEFSSSISNTTFPLNYAIATKL